MTACPDEATILAFGRGEGDPQAARLIQHHLAECDECRSLVKQVQRSSSVVPVAPAIALAPTTPLFLAGGQTVDSSPVLSPVKAGDMLASKYVVERVLGAGGMGVVVAAKHLALEQRVALKFLLPAACKAPDAVARFLREGKAAAQITSEHVARVADTGVLENGAPYLVMEYLEGSDLSALPGPVSPEDAVEYVLQAGEAIVEAHQLGIIHRDLKPANLFLTKRKDGSPLVKVLDFGISKAESDAMKNLTSSATMMGSPRYMSPEQMVSAKDVDARTDVWALGVILFELVTGQPVWNADTIPGLCALIATAPTPSIRAINPSLPAALDDAIARCLAKDPKQRVASVADLALLLEPLAPAPAQTSIERILRVAGRSRSALPLSLPKPPPVFSPSTPPAAVTAIPSLPPPRGHTGRIIVALASVIGFVALAAAGLLFYKGGGHAAARETHDIPPPVVAATPEPIVSIAPVTSTPTIAASALPSSSVTKPKRHRPPKEGAKEGPKEPAAPAPSPGPEPDRSMDERK